VSDSTNDPAGAPASHEGDEHLEGASELARRLRAAPAEELAKLVAEHAGRLPAEAACQALRNPFVSTEVIELLAAENRLLSFYQVRRELARSPRSPEALALRLVPGLYWRDLADLGLDMRLHPRLRRAADLALAARLPELAVGEKVAIARRASASLLAQLRHDPSPRVIAALLDNPRLTEGVLAPLVASDRAAPAVLQLIATDRRWGARYDLRLALARNPRTPAAAVLPILATLRKADLAGIAADPRVTDVVRRRARLLLGHLEQVI
jgi:hypothetical protein